MMSAPLHPASDKVEIEPLVSPDQSRFIAGDLTAADLWQIQRKEVHRRVDEEIARNRLHDSRRASMLFGAVGASVFVLSSIGLLITSNGPLALTSGLAGITMIVFTVAMAQLGQRWHPDRTRFLGRDKRRP